MVSLRYTKRDIEPEKGKEMNNLELANEYSNLIRTVLDRIDLYNNKYSDSDIVKIR